MGKRGFQPRETCTKGHNIAEVGRTKSGNCKVCNQEYYKIRREFIKKNFPKSL
jgi:hypothetical protein